MSADIIEMWHQRARPNPAPRDFDVQLGCHLEEICEMLAVVNTTHNDTLVRARVALSWLADGLKKGNVAAEISDRKEFLDAVADQIVTGIGAAYCAHMKPSEALYRVNRSNWSKYDVDGKPIFNEHGKITKGPQYEPPNLEGLY
jgi:predicted HAD superfamily Cof-like phosphohydrolase